MDLPLKKFNCSDCDYKTNREYNFKRHKVLVHTDLTIPKGVNNLPKSVPIVPNQIDNVPIVPTSVDNLIQNDVPRVLNDKTCVKCYKEFHTRWHADRHMSTCNPVDNRVCPHCNKRFSHRTAKWRHQKTCNVKLRMDAEAKENQGEEPDEYSDDDQHAVVSTEIEPVQNIVNNNITNNNTTTTNSHNNNNNINTNVNIDTQNNQVINLVVYNNDSAQTMQFVHDHIDPNVMKKFLVPGDRVQPDKLTDVVRQWTKQLMLNKQNNCVKKTNMRSSHSQVHVGNNTWESRLDKEVYPAMMNNIANDFSDYFNEKYRRNLYKALDSFIDYMASDGYCANDSDRAIENAYKTLVRELKLRTFDHTKTTKKA